MPPIPLTDLLKDQIDSSIHLCTVGQKSLEIAITRNDWCDAHWNMFAIADSIKEYLIQSHGFVRGTITFDLKIDSGEIKLRAPLIYQNDPVDIFE